MEVFILKVRIGIDVGGTFTDAVLIDNDTYQLMGSIKIPTTHDSPNGVADGIIQVINTLLERYQIDPSDVQFIAHGTTQATNALLEGDVSKVGVIGLGHGAEGVKVRMDTKPDRIELSQGKYLETDSVFLDTAQYSDEDIRDAVRKLQESGCEVFVAASAFSVDNPEHEKRVMECIQRDALNGTATYEISKLYGLRTRTRTAAINASILPRMMQTADMTQESVQQAKIKAPLMIMRCDGGVMDIAEVKKRPILTMLSGPAAGVAGALMYEKISNGIFLEVGGTSTDISAIKNGKVMIEYAQIGDNKTYLSSLDVRTVGIAGGSMVRINREGIVDAGPRSAHIAGLGYAVYADPSEIVNPRIVTISPNQGDPDDYLAIECANGNRYAITVSCAANLLGYVDKEDYSYGNAESVRLALAPLAEYTGKSPEQLAGEIMLKAAAKNESVVRQLMKDYNLQENQIVLMGGGGGCSAIVPHLAEHMQLKTANCRNASVISPIGVALAMVRDVIERNVMNPTEQDILKIRQEALQSAIAQGANAESVEIQIEVDAQKNVLRAIAVGATELRTKQLGARKLSDEEIVRIAAQAVSVTPDNVELAVSGEQMVCINAFVFKNRLFGLLRKKVKQNLVIDREGVIRIQTSEGDFYNLNVKNQLDALEQLTERHTAYGDSNMTPPDVYIFVGGKIHDYCGMSEKEQILSLAQTELAGIDSSTPVVALMITKDS